MKTYKTQTGGVYQVDGTKVRRVSGGSHYDGVLSNGEWYQAANVNEPEPGRSLIVFHQPGPGDRLGYTMTSPVISVEEDADV